MGAREDEEMIDPDAGSEEIQSEIERVLSRMDNTLEELGSRLRPGHLLHEVMGLFRSAPSSTPDEVETAAEAAENPERGSDWRRILGPAALIVAGVAWMVFEEERKRKRGKRVARPRPRRRRETFVEEEFDPETGAWREVNRAADIPPEPGAYFGSERNRSRD